MKLGDIARLQAGISFPKYLQGKNTGKVPFAKVGDISRTGRSGEPYIENAEFFVDDEEIQYLKGKPVPSGSILFAKIGEAIRQNHRVINTREMYIDNNAMAVVPDASEVNTDFLFWTLKDTDFYPLASSTTVPSIRKTQLENISISLPPIEEQRRIAETRNLQSLIEQKRERQRELWAELEKSFFIDMFGNPFMNPKGLPMARLGDVAEIVTGNSPSRADESNFGSDIEWIKSNNLGGRIATAAEEWLSESGKQKARIAPAGSVLVTCIAGSPESIGKCSLVDRDVAFNQQINAILPSENLSAEFILMQLKTFPELVRQKSSGGMKGLVSKSQFSEIEILNPDPILMKKFIDILQKEPGV